MFVDFARLCVCATAVETASRVQEDIELIGQSMDAKTIRKLLKEASVLVDASYWQA